MYQIVLSVVIMAIGAVIRCFARTPEHFWIIIVAQVSIINPFTQHSHDKALNAMAGPPVMALPPKISAMWFPVSERKTATAITGYS